MKTIAALILLTLLAACNGDGANPFAQPDQSAQPVECSASGACD